MAITTTITNSSPFMAYEGMATKATGGAIIPLDAPDEFNCDYVVSPYGELVFAHPDGEWYKNDKSDFLFKKVIATDTILIELYKNDVKIEDLNDNDFGTFFNGFTLQPLYVGYLLDWNLVYATYGVGNYQVIAQITSLSVTIEVPSRVFMLKKYTKELAHETVRIESVQNGNIFGNIFDHTGLEWYQSIRIPGVFGNPKPVYETDNYVTENHAYEQNKSKMNREFTLSIFPIPFEVVEIIIYNKCLANSILITDYNLFAEKEWKRLPVVLKDLSKPDIVKVQNKIYELQFIDKNDIFVKRNY